ncbi:MAG: class I SAM-dependent methyltransferase [Lysobacteraceae bacterium]
MNEAARWNPSAEHYALAVANIQYYLDSAGAIAELVAPSAPTRVMSLGCGSSGFLEKELLLRVPDIRNLCCIDISSAMLDSLRLRLDNPKASFVECAAENLADLDLPAFDCIVCSSALWLFDLDVALPAIADKLADHGSLAFSIAEWDLQDSDSPRPRPRRYQLIDEELQRRHLPPKPSDGSTRKLTFPQLDAALRKAGLQITDQMTRTTAMTGRDWQQFYAIPAIAIRSLPHIRQDMALEVLEAAMSSFPENGPGDPIGWRAIKVRKTHMAL